MSDYYNHYALKHFAGMIADCMGFSLPESFAQPIPWISEILKSRLGGIADRAILYHADAVGMYIWQKYTDLFAPVYRNSSMTVPFVSTVESVTPVAHASMYTGMDPEGHGILTYVRPQLTCTTLYDVLLNLGNALLLLQLKTQHSCIFSKAGKWTIMWYQMLPACAMSL